MSDTRACYEHWADADISFLAKGKDRLMSACSFVYGKDNIFAFSALSTPDHPPLILFSYTLWDFSVAFSDGKTAIRYGRLSPAQR